MKLASHIFRAYDIRGRAFIDMDEDGVFLIGQGIAAFLQEKHQQKNLKIFVSGDGRLSMEPFAIALIDGLKSQGVCVKWGGILPSPLNYFVLHTHPFDASIQITASHNPPEDNGFKIMDREGSICGEDLQNIYQRIKNKKPLPAARKSTSCPPVAFKKEDILASYHKKVRGLLPLRLVVDAGNGCAGLFYPDILRACSAEVTELYCDLDPTFPNHQPDPEEVENLKDLQQLLQTHPQKYDFGVAYDGDGDRLGVLLSDGTILSADKILFVLGLDLLSRHPGATIVVDIMSSAQLISALKKAGARVVLAPTGHSHIEKAMKTHHALLGGEQSGHMMFAEDFFGYDDACLATIRFLRATVENPEVLSKALSWKALHEYTEKIAVPEAKKFSLMAQLVAAIKKELLPRIPAQKVWEMDGIRVDISDTDWFIVRASNTSAKISIRVESENPTQGKKYFSAIKVLLQDLLKA